MQFFFSCSEENVWKLCEQVKKTRPEELSKCYAIFVSNEGRTVPLWRQKAGRGDDQVVIWVSFCILLFQFLFLLSFFLSILNWGWILSPEFLIHTVLFESLKKKFSVFFFWWRLENTKGRISYENVIPLSIKLQILNGNIVQIQNFISKFGENCLWPNSLLLTKDK